MPAAEGVEVKLDGSLMALARAYRSGGDVAVKALASAGDLAMDGNRLRVGVTVLDEARVAGVKARIEELGGEVAVELGNRLFALLPVAALEPARRGGSRLEHGDSPANRRAAGAELGAGLRRTACCLGACTTHARQWH